MAEAQRHTRLSRVQDAVSAKHEIPPQVGSALCRNAVIGGIQAILIAHLSAGAQIAIAHLVGSEQIVEREAGQVNVLQVRGHSIEFREETCRVGDGLGVTEERSEQTMRRQRPAPVGL